MKMVTIESADNNNSTEVVIPSVSTFFKINTNYFVNDGEVLINEFVSAYEKTNKKAVILVEGYTCDLGGTRLNDLLSESRAEAVKKLLDEAKKQLENKKELLKDNSTIISIRARKDAINETVAEKNPLIKEYINLTTNE